MVQASSYTLITSCSAETLCLGMNFVLYSFCVHTLYGQKSISCRLLLLINTAQFLLCVAQTALHTTVLFIVLTLHPGNTQIYLQRVSTYTVGSMVIFGLNFMISGCLSIWRLYVLYDNDIRVCVPALLVWIAQTCATGIAFRVCATTPILSRTFTPVNMLLWALITTLNLFVAVLICLRLYIAQKRTRTILSSSPYKSIAIVLVECGALITACSLAMMILYACRYTYALVNHGTATEIAVISQLLVTARLAMRTQGRRNRGLTSITLEQAESTALPTRTRYVSPPGLIETKTLCSFVEPRMQDKESLQPLDGT